MSNPETQQSTARASSKGGQAIPPRKAIQAATGARLSDAPSQKWARLVNRLV